MAAKAAASVSPRIFHCCTDNTTGIGNEVRQTENPARVHALLGRAGRGNWTFPDLVESHFLRLVVGLEVCFECCGAFVAKARMPPLRIVEAFDVKANGVAGFNA